MNIGDEYQKKTKYSRDTLGGKMYWTEREGPYKFYEEARHIELPEVKPPGDVDFWKLLAGRRSRRKYSTREMPFEKLAALLWAANGITGKAGSFEFRTTPSAGALYPVETYFVANRVENLEPGVYHHDPHNWRLDVIREGYSGDTAAGAALGQGMCERAAAVFIWTAIPARSKWKYRERAYRYIYLDAGHIGENVHLAAEALGMGCCMIGAFFDQELNSLLGVDGEKETAIYMAAAGMLD